MLSLERLLRIADETGLAPQDVFVGIGTEHIKNPSDPVSPVSELTVVQVAQHNVGGRSPVTFIMVEPDKRLPE